MCVDVCWSYLTAAEMAAEIHSTDLEQIEDALEHVAHKKMDLKIEVEELKTLKEDVSDYKEVRSQAVLLVPGWATQFVT